MEKVYVTERRNETTMCGYPVKWRPENALKVFSYNTKNTVKHFNALNKIQPEEDFCVELDSEQTVVLAEIKRAYELAPDDVKRKFLSELTKWLINELEEDTRKLSKRG